MRLVVLIIKIVKSDTMKKVLLFLIISIISWAIIFYVYVEIFYHKKEKITFEDVSKKYDYEIEKHFRSEGVIMNIKGETDGNSLLILDIFNRKTPPFDEHYPDTVLIKKGLIDTVLRRDMYGNYLRIKHIPLNGKKGNLEVKVNIWGLP